MNVLTRETAHGRAKFKLLQIAKFFEGKCYKFDDELYLQITDCKITYRDTSPVIFLNAKDVTDSAMTLINILLDSDLEVTSHLKGGHISLAIVDTTIEEDGTYLITTYEV